MAHQTLLARNYRGDIPMSAVEKFPILLSEAEEESSAVPPCFSDEGINVPLSPLSAPYCSLQLHLHTLPPPTYPYIPTPKRALQIVSRVTY